jgi:hypothetical protein
MWELNTVRDMDEIKDLFKLLLGMGAVAACVWLYLKGMAFLYERGSVVRRAPRLEIQTLFHGNTKDDKDQI